MYKKGKIRENIENFSESAMFASRWFMAPIYFILCLSLLLITIKVLQHFVYHLPHLLDMKMKEMLLFVLTIVDMALIGNLVLMIIFAGYENFVSKIEVARTSPDKPDWMGTVDFSGLKLKLIASIVAISGINLLETFMNIGEKNDFGDPIVTSEEVMLMITVHIIFIVSGVLLALMDFIASKTKRR